MTDDKTVISIRLKTGEDILAYYVGEEKDFIYVYRPIKIKIVMSFNQNVVTNNYMAEFYHPYADYIIKLQYDDISHYDIANFFFSRMYPKALGDLLVYQEVSHKKLTKIFDEDDIEIAMEGSKSFYYEQVSDYFQ